MNGKAVSWLLFLAVVVLGSSVVLGALLLQSPESTRVVEATIAHPNEVTSPASSTPADSVVGAEAMQHYNRLWFVGDVMLSRQVGQFMAERGYDFPWRGILPELEPDDALIINFEGCLSATKTFDWGTAMRFPVSPAAVGVLGTLPIVYASLANNHGLDCGGDDFRYTRALLEAHGITPLGHPVTLDAWSVATTTVGGRMVGLLAVHTLFAAPPPEQLATLVETLEATTELQIAYVHWGDEYEPQGNAVQRQFAENLVALGIDVVIGHHPHVVQDIERIGDALVLYSLGNFIFDQYFSAAVQEGLVAVLEAAPDLQIRLVPVSSVAERTQPRVLVGEVRQWFLDELAARSDERLQDAISEGVVPVSASLATSPKPGMIAP